MATIFSNYIDKARKSTQNRIATETEYVLIRAPVYDISLYYVRPQKSIRTKPLPYVVSLESRMYEI